MEGSVWVFSKTTPSRLISYNISRVLLHAADVIFPSQLIPHARTFHNRSLTGFILQIINRFCSCSLDGHQAASHSHLQIPAAFTNYTHLMSASSVMVGLPFMSIVMQTDGRILPFSSSFHEAFPKTELYALFCNCSSSLQLIEAASLLRP